MRRTVQMNIAKAQKIVKDSRYGADKKKEARKLLREAKAAGKLVTRTKRKTKTSKTTKPKRKTKTAKPKRKTKTTKTSKTAKSKRKTKTSKKKTLKRKTKKTAKSTSKRKTTSRSAKSSSAKIRFYDVKNKKYVKIPRADCKIKRNRSPRGGDRLVGTYKGRELHTFVKKGFKL